MQDRLQPRLQAAQADAAEQGRIEKERILLLTRKQKLPHRPSLPSGHVKLVLLWGSLPTTGFRKRALDMLRDGLLLLARANATLQNRGSPSYWRKLLNIEGLQDVALPMSALAAPSLR
eukprot:2730797-Amphidinium_carterae.1